MNSDAVAMILEEFPSAVFDVGEGRMVLSLDGEKGVVIEVFMDRIDLNLFKFEWRGPHTRVPSHMFWRSVPVDLPREELRDQINRARRARLRQYRECNFCAERFPPELMTGEACHGCASRYDGIVY